MWCSVSSLCAMLCQPTRANAGDKHKLLHAMSQGSIDKVDIALLTSGKGATGWAPLKGVVDSSLLLQLPQHSPVSQRWGLPSCHRWC